MRRARNTKNAPVTSVVTNAYATNARLDGAFFVFFSSEKKAPSASEPGASVNSERNGERLSRAAALFVPAPGAARTKAVSAETVHGSMFRSAKHPT